MRLSMPFYEYQCEKCGHDVEMMQKITDPPLKKCPQCGKSGLRRLMSAPVFRLKGSGWYETDFKSDQDAKRNLADKAEPEAKDDKQDSKTEAKKEDGKTEAPAADAAKPAVKEPTAADKSVNAEPSPSKPAASNTASAKAKPAAGRKAVPAKKAAAKAKKRR